MLKIIPTCFNVELFSPLGTALWAWGSQFKILEYTIWGWLHSNITNSSFVVHKKEIFKHVPYIPFNWSLNPFLGLLYWYEGHGFSNLELLHSSLTTCYIANLEKIIKHFPYIYFYVEIWTAVLSTVLTYGVMVFKTLEYTLSEDEFIIIFQIVAFYFKRRFFFYLFEYIFLHRNVNSLFFW